MFNLTITVPNGPWVGLVGVTVNHGRRLPRKCHLKQMGDVFAHGLGVWFAEEGFQISAPLFLLLGHDPRPPYFTVGEGDKEIGIHLHRIVVMEGIVLAVLEGDEAIDGYFSPRESFLEVLGVEQVAMPGHPGNNPVDGYRVHLQVPGNLSVSHAPDNFHEDFWDKIRIFQPVGDTECLGAEGATA